MLYTPASRFMKHECECCAPEQWSGAQNSMKESNLTPLFLIIKQSSPAAVNCSVFGGGGWGWGLAVGETELSTKPCQWCVPFPDLRAEVTHRTAYITMNEILYCYSLRDNSQRCKYLNMYNELSCPFNTPADSYLVVFAKYNWNDQD
jgi:hypothetical protein